eukprot:TRINITY_DN1301_c0_g1_i1.p1 TRINITY_DN1301_c0_g1~~TRINITY_DN1301_c0_g1_i1.p1  ORF type:complete len:121 (+),score=13.00 TRINITY_DN1301_c0_g1_i1:1-363(+)
MVIIKRDHGSTLERHYPLLKKGKNAKEALLKFLLAVTLTFYIEAVFTPLEWVGICVLVHPEFGPYNRVDETSKRVRKWIFCTALATVVLLYTGFVACVDPVGILIRHGLQVAHGLVRKVP